MNEELPEGWDWASVEELLNGALFTDGDWVESKDQDPAGTVRLLQLADVGEGAFRDKSNRWLNQPTADRLSCTFVEEGDVLVARMPDPLGRACLVPSLGYPAVTVVDVCVMRPNRREVDSTWLMWAVNAPQFRARVLELQSGTTRKRISRKNLSTIQLPVPPRAEQERIVAVIEENLSRLAAAEASVVSARFRLEMYRRSAILQLFDEPGWAWTTLGEIAEIKGGVTKDSKRQNDPDFVEVPYLRVANVQRGYLDLSEVSRIRVSPKKADQLKLLPGDILFNEGGDRDKLGRGWVWDGQIEGCIHQNHVFRARLVRDDFDPRFVSTHGNSWGQQWFEKNGKQTTNLASLNLTTLKAFPVPAPPRSLQLALMRQLDDLLRSQRRLASEVHSAEARAASLRRSILSAAFAGQLSKQDPCDEPASAQLERIAAERPVKRYRKKRSS